jgi:hypothetical protein
VVESSALHSWLGVVLRTLKYQITHTFSMGAPRGVFFVDALHQTALRGGHRSASVVRLPVVVGIVRSYFYAITDKTGQSYRSFPSFTERRRPKCDPIAHVLLSYLRGRWMDRPPSGLVLFKARGEFSHIGRRARKHAGSSWNTKRRRRFDEEVGTR